MTEVGVDVQSLERVYGKGENAVHVLRGVDLCVTTGTLVALYGPSGSGKTTLLNLIGTLDHPTAGRISLFGKDIIRMNDEARATLRRDHIGFIFQSDVLVPTYTALENVDLILRLQRLGYRARQARARVALEAVGLSAWVDHYPDELSGGQRQRIAIARALAVRPPLILADEPSAGLDTRMTRHVFALFRGIAKAQNVIFIIATHDILIAELVDAVYDLQDGKLVPRREAISA
jgi:ABC-type lipoprotein export system ATPase subunit